MSIPVGASRLIGVFCPRCEARAGTITLEGSPVLIRHERRYTPTIETLHRNRTLELNRKQRCRGLLVAIPDRHQNRVRVIQARNRDEADAVLRTQTDLWLERQAREVAVILQRAQTVSDVFGVTV